MRDKISPVTVGLVTLIACAGLPVRMYRALATDAVFADLESGPDDGKAPHGLWGQLGWFVFLLVLASLLGFIVRSGYSLCFSCANGPGLAGPARSS